MVAVSAPLPPVPPHIELKLQQVEQELRQRQVRIEYLERRAAFAYAVGFLVGGIVTGGCALILWAGL